MVKTIRSSAGFSLVELMVVVAIVGILAMVAIPNFQAFQRKAKTAEAKALLGGVYAAEIAFKSEWGAFYGDLYDIGFAPSGKLNYDVGWPAVQIPTSGHSYAATSTNYPNANTFCPTANSGCQAASVTVSSTGTPAVAADGTTFKVIAEGNLGVTGRNDVWSMNHLKVLAVESNGTL